MSAPSRKPYFSRNESSMRKMLQKGLYLLQPGPFKRARSRAGGTLRSSLHIAESTIFHRPYDDAPVSNLFLFGREEDLAFEKPVDNDARRRHHVRFWQVPAAADSGKPYWLG